MAMRWEKKLRAPTCYCHSICPYRNLQRLACLPGIFEFRKLTTVGVVTCIPSGQVAEANVVDLPSGIQGLTTHGSACQEFKFLRQASSSWQDLVS